MSIHEPMAPALPTSARPGPAVAGGSARPAAAPRRVRLDAALAALFRGAELGFGVVALLLFSHALLPLSAAQGGPEVHELTEGNVVMRTTFLALQALAVLWGMLRWRGLLRAALAHRLTLALVAVALLSVVWSAAPELTLRRGVALTGTTAVGVYLASRYSLRTLLLLLGWALGIAAVLCVVFAVAVPELGVSAGRHDGAWRGVYTHKNTMGQIMVLSTAAFFLLWKDARRHRWVPLGGTALSALLVVLSTSTTALLILVSLGAVLPLYRALRWQRSLLMAALCFVPVVGVGALTVFLANSAAVFGTFGKDTTLTGRSGIWEALLPSIGARPWLGYGYNAFWLGRSGESGRVMSEIGFNPINAHNGYLDVLVGLGAVGLAIFLAGTVLALLRAAALVRSTDGWTPLWPLLFLTFILLYNLSESALLQSNTIYWILYVAAVCTVGMRHPTREGAASHPGRPAGEAPRPGGVAYPGRPAHRHGRGAASPAPLPCGRRVNLLPPLPQSR